MADNMLERGNAENDPAAAGYLQTDDITQQHADIIETRSVKSMPNIFDKPVADIKSPRSGDEAAEGAGERRARRAAPPVTGEDDEERSFSEMAGAVASDVGEGLFVESPRQIVGGIVDGLTEAAQSAIEFQAWTTKNTPQWLRMTGLVGLPVSDAEIARIERAQGGELGQKEIAQLELAKTLVPPARTVTGGMVRSVSQFLTGFVGTGKFTGTAKAGTALVRAANAAMRGAVADAAFFDAQDANLSNLIQEYPQLQNPITEFLATDPNDRPAVNRLRRVLEGLGLGVMTDGMVLAAKGIRGWRAAKAAREAAGETGKEVAMPGLSNRDFAILGDPNAPLIEPRGRGRPREFPADGPVPDDAGEVFINWARIDSADDVKTVMQDMANRSKGEIDRARRGKRSFVEIQQSAAEQDAWRVLQERQSGQPLNAEQSVAVRNLWTASGRKLNETAMAASVNPTPANLFAFRRMMAIHRTVQEQVIAARTETARALASWRIPSEAGELGMRRLEFMLENSGGEETARALADKVAKLSDMPIKRDAFVERGALARTVEGVRNVWINALLSGPKTHIVNAMSNTAVLFQQMGERAFAARISRALGTEGGVEIGEATAQWFGTVEGIKDMFHYAAVRSKLPVSDIPNPFENPATALRRSKIDAAAEATAQGIARSGWMGRSADAVNAFVNIPGTALEMSDQVFKTLGYRAELHALSLRRATQEVRAGNIRPDQMKAYIADLLSNPPENLKMDAVDQALYNTFQNNPVPFGRAVMRLRDKSGAPGWIIMPFVRTPINITTYAFERAPALNMLHSGWRADYAAGGARRDIALARTATGAAIMAATADLTLSGQLTGGGPEGQHRPTGFQRYSLKIGDRQFAYNRTDPLGMTLGLSADLTEVLAQSDFDRRDTKTTQEVAAAVASSIAANITSKTYMSGVADLFGAIKEGPAAASGFNQVITRLAGSAVPAGVAEAARQIDPTMREARDMVDAMRRRTPYLSQDVPPNRDFMGRERSYESGLGWVYDAVSPIYSKVDARTPFDEALMENGITFQMPSRIQTFNGVPVDLDRHEGAYSRFMELSGQELEDPLTGMNMEETMNAIVTGEHIKSQTYDDASPGPDGSRKSVLGGEIAKFRQRGRRALLEEFPSIQDEVMSKTDSPFGILQGTRIP